MTVRTFANLQESWPSIVGAQVAHVSRPAALDSCGVLHVIVSSRSWRDDLDALSARVLASLPSSLEGMPVRRIRWALPVTVRRARRAL